MKHIICNQIVTPDGTILISHSVHDFKQHEDEVSKETYFVDGGREYLKRSVNVIPYIEMSVFSDEPFERIRQHFYWKTADGRFVKLCDMTNAHVDNILNDYREWIINLKQEVVDIFNKEVEYRYVNKIWVR